MPRPLQLATAAMGTRFEIVIADADADVARQRAAGEDAIERIDECHRRYNRFATDSFLTHINRFAAQRPVRIDAETLALLTEALEVQRASGGAFAVAARGGVPSADALIELDADACTVRLREAGAALDLGGIAKGHALDAAAGALREHGVRCALLHGGTSSIVAIGAPLDTDGWRVALGPDAAAPVVTLVDRCLSVSGTARGHIIDARTGAAVARPRHAAVLGASCRTTDAWSTALAILGSRPRQMPDALESIFVETAE